LSSRLRACFATWIREVDCQGPCGVASAVSSKPIDVVVPPLRLLRAPVGPLTVVPATTWSVRCYRSRLNKSGNAMPQVRVMEERRSLKRDRGTNRTGRRSGLRRGPPKAGEREALRVPRPRPSGPFSQVRADITRLGRSFGVRGTASQDRVVITNRVFFSRVSE
jgi:hypothetical protein